MNSGTKAAKFRALAGLAALIFLVSGCAGGGLLDRSIADADLPTDSTASPYPTAIRNPSQTPTQTAASNASSQQAAAEPHSRHDHPQPLVTPLAVIPPVLVRAAPPAPHPISPTTLDGRQTLVDLTPATNWSPPSLAQRMDADASNTGTAANSSMLAASRPAVGAVAHASVTDAETEAKADSSSDRRQQIE